MGSRKHLRNQAFRLRLAGNSYGQILKKLKLPSKGTLSGWFHELTLTPQARRMLAKNVRLAWKRGLTQFNARRSKRIRDENESVFNKASKAIGDLSRRDLLLVGTCLYWGEGTLREGKKSPVLSFSNSDPKMVKIFMRYLREILAVPNDRIYGGIQIHPNISERRARTFWGDIVGISPARFSIYRSISRASKFKRPKHFLPFGTVNIRTGPRQLFYQMKGYVNGLSEQK